MDKCLESPAPWWNVLESWKLIGTNSKSLISRLEKIRDRPDKARCLFRELIAAFPAAIPLHASYDQHVQASAPPTMHWLDLNGFIKAPNPALVAACLAYETVVVTDPMWLPVAFWHMGRSGTIKRDGLEDRCVEYTMELLRDVLCPLMPLAVQGIIRFDALWGYPLAKDPLARELIAGIPPCTKAALKTKYKYDTDDVFYEAAYAAVRARMTCGAVGSGDPEFHSAVRALAASSESGLDPEYAVELPIILPYTETLNVQDLLRVRIRHSDTLAQFRAAMFSMTRDLRALKPEDVQENRVGQAVRDHLEGELAKLRREWNAIKTFGGVTVATAGLSVALATLRVTTGLPPALGELPLIAAGLTFAGGLTTLGIDILRMKANNVYVLWQAERLSRK